MSSAINPVEGDLDDDDYQFMSRCLELAEKAAALGEVPVGALIVLDGKVIAEGFNQPIGLNDPTAHAEVQAIRAAAIATGNYRLPGAKLYVNVEPCSMCAGAMVHARINHLVYGATETRAGAVVSKSKLLNADYLNHQVSHTGGCMAAESGILMKQFFRNRRKNSRK